MEQRWYWVGFAVLIAVFSLVSLFQLFPGAGLQQLALSEGDFSRAGGSGQNAYSFAPEVSERLITRSASITTEVERGTVQQAMARVRAIAEESGTVVISEDYSQSSARQSARYTLKVPAEAYAGVVASLKSLGDLQQLSEDAEDITGRVEDLEVELVAERERLDRLKELSARRPSLSDQLELERHIFDQQRRVYYLEKELSESSDRVRYSTVSLTVREEESALASLDFVGFKQLLATFINSVEVLLYALSAALPWVLAGLAVFGLWRVGKRRK